VKYGKVVPSANILSMLSGITNVSRGHQDQYKEFLADIRKMWRTQRPYSPQQLASIRSPTLVIDGEYDEIIKRSHTEEMSHLIPNAKLAILPGCHVLLTVDWWHPGQRDSSPDSEAKATI
jgi:pimeloyl-ACP methyl ester carboxylesterase